MQITPNTCAFICVSCARSSKLTPSAHNISLLSQALGIVLSRMNKTKSSSRPPPSAFQGGEFSAVPVADSHNTHLTTPQQGAFFICPLHDWSHFLSPFYASLLG